MNAICYFEIPAKDMNRAREFYNKLFDWKINEFKGETASKEPYMTIETPKSPEALCGGIMPKMQEGHTITMYVSVDSVDEYSKKVEELGGKICVPKMAVPGMGWFACCNDPEGNTFAIWQCDKEAKMTEEQAT
jgi:predicted enzyme related to lactoylglutathione lyase